MMSKPASIMTVPNSCPLLTLAPKAGMDSPETSGWNVDTSCDVIGPVGMSMKPPTCRVAMCKIGKGGKAWDGLSGP